MIPATIWKYRTAAGAEQFGCPVQVYLDKGYKQVVYQFQPAAVVDLRTGVRLATVQPERDRGYPEQQAQSAMRHVIGTDRAALLAMLRYAPTVNEVPEVLS